MDGYAHMMLNDDISPEEDYEMECPNCGNKIKVKIVDQHVRCLKCGEILYLEDLGE